MRRYYTLGTASDWTKTMTSTTPRFLALMLAVLPAAIVVGALLAGLQ